MLQHWTGQQHHSPWGSTDLTSSLKRIFAGSLIVSHITPLVHSKGPCPLSELERDCPCPAEVQGLSPSAHSRPLERVEHEDRPGWADKGGNPQLLIQLQGCTSPWDLRVSTSPSGSEHLGCSQTLWPSGSSGESAVLIWLGWGSQTPCACWVDPILQPGLSHKDHPGKGSLGPLGAKQRPPGSHECHGRSPPNAYSYR